MSIVTAGIIASAILITGCTSDPHTRNSNDSAEKTVTIALDWEANTNHTGIFVAEKLGYFAEHGLNVEIVPYGGIGIPELIEQRQANFGVADQTAVQVSRTAGSDIVSVFRITQTETGRIIYMPDRTDISSPKDLDGLVFGGFDSPLYAGIAAAVIQGDGGKGTFSEVTLNTSTYEALNSGAVDFTLSVANWEDILAEMEGRAYGTFKYQDFGMPDVQTLGIVSSDEYLIKNPTTTHAFLDAIKRGYEFATKNPAEAAEILIKANPEQLTKLRDLTHESARVMAEQYYVREGFEIGAANPGIWEEYGQFLLDSGFLFDAQGQKVTIAPDWSVYYTDAFLSE